MLTLAGTECVGESVRVNWNRDVERGVTSSARAGVAKAPPCVTLQTSDGGALQAKRSMGVSIPRVRLGTFEIEFA